MEAPPGPGPMELDAPPPAAAAAAAAATAAIPSAGSDKVSGWPRSGSGGGGRGLAPPDLMLLCLLQHKVDGEGGDAVTGHIISTTIGGKNGEPKRVSYHFLSLSVLPACLCLSCRCVRQILLRAAIALQLAGSDCAVAAFAVGTRT